jgi:hypothetical protein
MTRIDEIHMLGVFTDKRIVDSAVLSNTRSKLKRSLSIMKNNN